jgi:uncharacterized cupin superfamily protein
MSPEPDGMAASRLLVDDAFTIEHFAPSASEAGATRLVDTPVSRIADVEVGLWQIDAGSATDVEADEVFLVLAGSGQVTFSDGSVLPLRPGVLVRLVEGDQTIWVIDQPLRKLYVAWPSQARGDIS